jgi:hypothetical protein
MNDPTGEIRALARKLLESGEVHCLIGWEKGDLWFQSRRFCHQFPGHLLVG